MSPTSLLALQMPPILAQAGFSTHGRSEIASTEHYRLPRLWCLHWYDYHACLEVDEESWEIHPGGVSLIPPDRSLTYHFQGLSSHYYAHFALVDSAPEQMCSVAKLWFEVDEIPSDFRHGMERMVRAWRLRHGGCLFSHRAEVALWELLCQLAEASPQRVGAASLHPSLQRALALIEERLADGLAVASLAHDVGLSHNQLTRLFIAHTGRTIVAYIRHRRAERAKHLLQNSTLAIKTIAAQVGVPDLGQFNHLLRRETGLSPRALRGAPNAPGQEGDDSNLHIA